MPGRDRPRLSTAITRRVRALKLAHLVSTLAAVGSGLADCVDMPWWCGGVALAAAAIVWLGAASSAQALELLVDTTVDSAAAAFQVCNPSPSAIDCSLRGAILRANAVPGPHTITLPAGRYDLAPDGLNEDGAMTGDLDIAQNITINGVSPDTTVISYADSTTLAHRDRIFDVLSSGNLTIRDLSVRGGGHGTAVLDYGGDVRSEGSLTIERVSVRLGSQSQGGGLYLEGNTVIRDSAINSNTATTGAGILIGGNSAFTVSIQNSTISTNGASDVGGGIDSSTGNVNSVVTLNNVTVANNSASISGGLYANSGSPPLLRNTIIANNMASSSNPNCFGTIGSQGHNLVYGGDTCGMVAAPAGTDIVNGRDPKLLALGRYGGPTATHALGFNSAALDQGDTAAPGTGGTACEAKDQRGLQRTIDGDADGIARCDIGAAEGGVWYAVNTTVDSNDPSYQACDDSLVPWNCSLRGAISNANGNSQGTSVITLPATGAGNPYRLTVHGASEDMNATGDLDLRSGMTIVGGGANTTIVDGDGADRVFHVINNGSHNVTLQDLTMQNGNAGAASGGGILVEDFLALLRVRVRANTARNGAGIFFLNVGGTIFDSTISSNITTAGGVGGGGIGQSTAGTVTITNSTIALNQSVSGGGGLLQIGGSTTANLKNVTIAGNGASAGGGILQAGTVSVVNTIVAGNTANIAGTSNCGGAGTPTSQGYNLEFGGSTCGFTQGTDRQNQDPKLGPLQFNGGPTETMALGPDSAATDAGNTATPGSSGVACTTADQRGSPRPVDGDGQNGARCDIGAYELQTPFPADLAVSIADAPDPIAAGHPLTYTVTVTNNGPASATGVSLTDTLPAGVSFGSATPSQGSCAGTSTVICTLGTLASAASATVTLVVTPSQGGSLSNTASASAQLPDPTPANNAATAVTSVQTNCQPRPNVRVTTAVAGAGQLSATIAAQTSAATPANSLSSIRITSIGNATVQVNGTPVAVNQTVTLPAGSQQAVLLLQRQTAGQATTVAFEVVDGCGMWKSFVGGGAGAF